MREKTKKQTSQNSLSNESNKYSITHQLQPIQIVTSLSMETTCVVISHILYCHFHFFSEILHFPSQGILYNILISCLLCWIGDDSSAKRLENMISYPLDFGLKSCDSESYVLEDIVYLFDVLYRPKMAMIHM